MVADALVSNWVTVSLAGLNVVQTIALALIAARAHHRRSH
jgi:hypothetical protein